MSLAADRAPDPPAPRESGADAQAAVVLLLFASARVAAGTGRAELHARSVAELLHQARARYGEQFAAVLDGSKVWVNGEPSSPERQLCEGDEVAVLPPVSGGSKG
jgi:molybdopterin synthase sulfur carrier subunit